MFKHAMLTRKGSSASALLVFICLFSLPATFANEAEEAAPTSQYVFLFLGLLFGLIIGVLGAYAYFLRHGSKVERETKPKVKLMVNTRETEERLLRIIAGKGGKINQNELTALASISKARASEVLSELEERGIIYKRPKGRTNVIVLKEEYYEIE